MSMTQSLLVWAWLVPLLAAAFATRPLGRWLVPAAALPGLAAALLVPAGTTVEIPWLLLGTMLGLDEISRVLLLPSVLVWLVAGVYVAGEMREDPRIGRFRVFFLLAMAGNLWLLLAQDMAGFYLGFALMGLAAYGLVAHRRSACARHAGRTYLAWTIAGEIALFAGLVLLAAGSGGLGFAGLDDAAPSGWAVGLVVVGFGIKMALPGLHFWLPLTYPAAPAAGAAVLAGPMIKAGLLGLLRFLPPGEGALTAWGPLLTAAGLTGVAVAFVFGLMARDPKAVLAWSSMGKMGLLAAGLGAAWAVPEAAPALVAALLAYAVWHLLAKGALFLGVGVSGAGAARPWVLGGLVLLALALIGVPFTGVADAKAALKLALPGDWGWLGLPLAGAAFASSVLMARFLFLMLKRAPRRPPAGAIGLAAWALLTGIALVLPFRFGTFAPTFDGAGPLAAGAAVAVLAIALGLRAPAGRMGRAWARHWRRRVRGFADGLARSAESVEGTVSAALHHRMSSAAAQGAWPARLRWSSAGALWLGLSALLLAALALGG